MLSGYKNQTQQHNNPQLQGFPWAGRPCGFSFFLETGATRHTGRTPATQGDPGLFPRQGECPRYLS